MQQSRIAVLAGAVLVLALSVFGSAFVPRAAAGSGAVVWTAIIPDGFPGNIYTWRLKPDGTYEEDGRDAVSGGPVEQTLSGRWSVDGARMILRQDRIAYVFDGMLGGGHYWGTLYLDGREVSQFCAAKGTSAPAKCDTGQVASASEF